MNQPYALYAWIYRHELAGTGCKVRSARIHCGESDIETTPTREHLVHHAKESGYEMRNCAPNIWFCVYSDSVK